MIASRPILVLAALLTLPFVGACTITNAVVGDDLPDAALQAIEPGRSTESDVIREVGPPSDVAPLETGSIFVYRLTEENTRSLQLSYGYASGGYTGEQRRFGAVVIFFDHKGVVTGWGLSYPR